MYSMLVLTRKMTQTIKFGENITITVVRTSQGSVILGVEAPRSIRVMRAEFGNSTCSQLPEQKVA